ncbi:MAG: hypothetical protein V3W44_09605 [Dehalococcoidales bacterium]
MAIPQYFGRFEITSANQDFSFNDGSAHAMVIPTGFYYTAGYTSESTNQLVEAVNAQLETISAAYGCNWDDVNGDGTRDDTGTNRITLDFTGAGSNVSVTFTDAGVAALLGFSGNITATAKNYTGTQTPRHTWQPTLAPSHYAGVASKFWIPEFTAKVQRSKDGTTHTIPGNTLYFGGHRFSLLPEADVQVAATVYRDLEQFFLDVVGNAQPIRILPDRTSYTSTSYVTGYAAGRDAGEVGGLDDYRSRWSESFDGLWDVDLEFVKKV